MWVFHAADFYDVVEQLSAVACWAMAARYGWWFAGFSVRSFREFFQFLRQLLHRKPRP